MSAADYPEALADLREHATQLLQRRGIDAQQAQSVAHELAEYMRIHWGGQKLYIGKGRRWALTERDQEIYRRFNGRNHLSLCRDYDISEERLRQILISMRADHQRRAQGGLF